MFFALSIFFKHAHRCCDLLLSLSWFFFFFTGFAGCFTDVFYTRSFIYTGLCNCRQSKFFVPNYYSNLHSAATYLMCRGFYNFQIVVTDWMGFLSYICIFVQLHTYYWTFQFRLYNHMRLIFFTICHFGIDME